MFEMKSELSVKNSEEHFENDREVTKPAPNAPFYDAPSIHADFRGRD
jgi:hypothetical protein